MPCQGWEKAGKTGLGWGEHEWSRHSEVPRPSLGSCRDFGSSPDILSGTDAERAHTDLTVPTWLWTGGSKGVQLSLAWHQ